MTARPQFEHLVRLGLAVRGVVFVLLGYVAFASHRGESALGVIARMRALPLGSVLLTVSAVGLAALALFRLAEAWFDLESRGNDTGGRLGRAGRAIGGLAYGALGLAAGWLALGGTVPGEADAARVVSGAGSLMTAVGIGLIAAAIAQFVTAATGRFMRGLGPGAPRAMRWAGGIGFAARGVILLMIGYYATRAGLGGARLRDSAAVLDRLSRHELLFDVVTIGLVAFGLFSLAQAHFRRLPDDQDLGHRARKEFDDITRASGMR